MTVDRRRFAALLAGSAVAASARQGTAKRSFKVGEVVEGEELPGREASWYKKLEEDRVECGLCPQGCTVADAERGTCGVRENRGGTYYTLVHSMACSLHADPIEKKPFFHVLPGELALSFATAGCNVECKFCQNWEISQFRPEQVRSVYLPPEALVEMARRASAKAVAATYSEPVVFWEYVRDTARAAEKAGLLPTVVTNGFIKPEPLKEVLPHLGAVKVDLKSYSESFYREQIRGSLKPVLDALEMIRRAGVWLEIVVLLIPTLNDSESEVRGLSRWVKANLGSDVPLHFTRFHPTYRLTDLPPTPVPTLETAWKIARAEGLNHVYLGNVPGHPGENTICPGCGETVIRRLGFKILENRMKEGGCPECQRQIAGLWR